VRTRARIQPSFLRVALLVPALLLAARSAPAQESSPPAAATSATVCAATGAPPIRTDEPATIPLYCSQGKLLSFRQNGVSRYACLNAPAQVRREAASAGRKWPLLVYLHGSLTTPESLYLSGRNLFRLHDTYDLSGDPQVKGFYVLSPEGRRATPWPAEGGNGPVTGSGFHWDEWYRSSTENLDALAIDHFLDETVAAGRIDPKRIYVFGWSNGAYMTVLYANWRSGRIAASAQFAGADPWSRTPCPVPVQATRKVPLVLLRNLCDHLVPCPTTAAWVDTLTGLGWPLEVHNLDLQGAITAAKDCVPSCSKDRGIYEHVRWPDTHALAAMLAFLKQHPLP
jgi:poly(3-hydroxybutyrate) depolymerase